MSHEDWLKTRKAGIGGNHRHERVRLTPVRLGR